MSQLPIDTSLLFKFLGEAEYKNRLYVQTMTQQMQQINQLTAELNDLKDPKKENDVKE